jgi:hypothetical protein
MVAKIAVLVCWHGLLFVMARFRGAILAPMGSNPRTMVEDVLTILKGFA